jgi:hypothetical protein
MLWKRFMRFVVPERADAGREGFLSVDCEEWLRIGVVAKSVGMLRRALGAWPEEFRVCVLEGVVCDCKTGCCNEADRGPAVLAADVLLLSSWEALGKLFVMVIVSNDAIQLQNTALEQ